MEDPLFLETVEKAALLNNDSSLHLEVISRLKAVRLKEARDAANALVDACVRTQDGMIIQDLTKKVIASSLKMIECLKKESVAFSQSTGVLKDTNSIAAAEALVHSTSKLVNAVRLFLKENSKKMEVIQAQQEYVGQLDSLYREVPLQTRILTPRRPTTQQDVMTEFEWNVLLANAKFLTFKKDEHIITLNSTKALYYIRSGEVQIRMKLIHSTVLVATFKVGDVFWNEMSFELLDKRNWLLVRSLPALMWLESITWILKPQPTYLKNTLNWRKDFTALWHSN